MNEREKLVAPCGIDCGTCEFYLSKHNEQILEYLVSKGIPKNILPCKGCRNIDGKCPIMTANCDTYTCTKSKGVDFCSNCSDFPCSMLAPAADRANTLPHNLKIYNLCTIKRDGLESFLSQSGKIKLTYFKGKMVIGKGPIIEN
ncbi:MAG: hypothetical protein CVT98_02335 [Bacteroidetes bacterium HGW-Bacteroidetes-15]|nr:MAG: hypothetical protein CVT98_02335 [Bacteroidetes bacterium HGW-Bacteroidetes-15]